MSTPQFATSMPKKGILKNRTSIDEPNHQSSATASASISSSSLNKLSK